MNTDFRMLLGAVAVLSLQQYADATSQQYMDASSASTSDSEPEASSSASGGVAVEVADQNMRRKKVNANWKDYFGNFESLGDGATKFVWDKEEVTQLTVCFYDEKEKLSRDEFAVALGALGTYSKNNLLKNGEVAEGKHAKKKLNLFKKKKKLSTPADGCDGEKGMKPLTSAEFIPLLFDYIQREGLEKGLLEEQVAKVREFVAAKVKRFLLGQNAKNLMY